MKQVPNETQAITIRPEITVTIERISDLLCSALEGGSNYWYKIRSFHKPAKLTFRCIANSKQVFRHLDYPLNEGGALMIESTEEPDRPAVKLDLEAIQRGLLKMAESKECAHHWRDFMAGTDDQNTGDVFLQLCLFGEVIYG
jgi:hypothetical protein